jgi:hypothetical protein
MSDLLDSARARRELAEAEQALAGEVVGGPAVYLSGGWGDTRDDRLSPQLAKRMAQEDARDAREARQAEQVRRELQARREQENITASIQLAFERGEDVDVRRAYADGGVGRTPREAIEYASALGDVDDMREAARQQAAYRKWQLEQSADTSADTSAPTAAQKFETEQMAARAAELRAFSRQQLARSGDVEKARSLAAKDRRRALGR